MLLQSKRIPRPMTANTPKARHPVKVAGKIVAPGGDIDPAKVGETRLARLIAKGRVTAANPEAAPVNRAEPAGRQQMRLPDKDVKA